MKRIHLFLLWSVLSFAAEAQEFVPLRIDSSYSSFRSFDFFGNPIEIVASTAYSYDLEDQLVQIRKEDERSNFTYSGSQEVETVEVFSGGVWTNVRRITTTFFADLPVQIKTEVYSNGFWENSKLITINYTNSDLIQVQLTQIWEDNGWVNQEKIENTYDSANNRISQSYFNVNEDNNFIFTFGDRILFNANNQPTEILSLTGNSGGIFFSDKFIFSYNSQQLADTVIYCLYNFPDTLNCENLSRSVFTYDSEENLVIRDIESWNNGSEWLSSGREETYAGRNIYSGLPDSILTYDYSLPTIDQLITRQYYVYEDLNEEEVLYKESLFLYDFNFGQFFLENYLEEFYQKVNIVANEEILRKNKITLFPNPVGTNQMLTVKYESPGSGQPEIYLFNITGQLLNQQKLGFNSSFIAPDTPGLYFIQIKNEEVTTTLQKLIVH